LNVSDHPKEFGHRQPPVVVQPPVPVKRSGHVALLVMGTVAIGGGAYALMPSEHCDSNRPGIAAPGPAGDCSPRGSSSSSGGHGGYWGGGSSSRVSFFGDSSASSQSSGSTSDAGHVTRGGFGSFAHAFAMHFSGGG
jgi:hypothetical protein